MAFRELVNSTTVDASDMNGNFQAVRAGSILPMDGVDLDTTDSAFNLGADAIRWNNIYANVFDFNSATTAGKDLWVLINEVTFSATALTTTFTGLNGDVDDTYMILARSVKDSGSGVQTFGFWPNGDSTGANYGRQRLSGVGATATASRNGVASVILGVGNSVGATYIFSRAILYAKTGQERTIISLSLEGASGTSVGEIVVRGHLWNDTSNTITSIVFGTVFAVSNTNIQLWARR